MPAFAIHSLRRRHYYKVVAALPFKSPFKSPFKNQFKSQY